MNEKMRHNIINLIHIYPAIKNESVAMFCSLFSFVNRVREWDGNISADNERKNEKETYKPWI